MIQMEHDYQGSDCAVNVKAINPSPVDLSGVYIGSYMQSLTKNLALGAESVYQAGSSQIPGVPPVTTSYVGKYTSTNKDWIASAQFQPAGMFTAGYWQKISDKVEAAAELQMVSTQGKRDAVATLGAKYDFRSSTFRAQVDSTGKVSALLEQRFAPTFAFIVAGEIEHFKVRYIHFA
jgi:mitochondrial import receptor subunit TOM40